MQVGKVNQTPEAVVVVDLVMQAAESAVQAQAEMVDLALLWLDIFQMRQQ
jgi:hypothetical protein